MNLIDMMCVCVFMMKAFGLIDAPWWLVTVLMVTPTVKFFCYEK